MPRTARSILLHLLLLLVSLAPLRGFAMPPMAETAVVNECEHAVPAAVRQQQAAEAEDRCAFCQVPGCEDGQCNMALCSAFHTPVTFLSFAAIVPVHVPATERITPPGDIFSHRTEPPLIRPPIALHG